MSLYIMRHAPTSLNKETEGPERIRGWGNAGLDDDGRAVAREAATMFHGKPPSVILTSDLPRAKETAEELAKELGGVQVVPLPELRTWNVGTLTGKLVSEAKPQLDDLQHLHQSRKAPQGESYADFYERWGKLVQRLRQMGKTGDVLVVVHGRQVYSLPNLLSGKGPRDIPTDGPPNPGDVLKVEGTTAKVVHRSGSPAKATA